MHPEDVLLTQCETRWLTASLAIVFQDASPEPARLAAWREAHRQWLHALALAGYALMNVARRAPQWARTVLEGSARACYEADIFDETLDTTQLTTPPLPQAVAYITAMRMATTYLLRAARDGALEGVEGVLNALAHLRRAAAYRQQWGRLLHAAIEALPDKATKGDGRLALTRFADALATPIRYEDASGVLRPATSALP